MKKKCPLCGNGKAKRLCMIQNDEAICSKCCVEWLRETTRKLRSQPTNMITCSQISTYQQRLAEP